MFFFVYVVFYSMKNNMIFRNVILIKIVFKVNFRIYLFGIYLYFVLLIDVFLFYLVRVLVIKYLNFLLKFDMYLLVLFCCYYC